MKNVRILLVEDDADFGDSFAIILKRKGYLVVLVPSAVKALERLAEERFDLVISDVVMPQMNGLEFVKIIKEQGMDVPVIMLSGYGNVKEAVEAMKIGAYNYFLKPVNQDEICLTIEKAIELKNLKWENEFLRGELQDLKGNMFLSNNDVMKSIIHEAEILAQSDVNVLIMGESGTGKELLARFIHDSSRRSSCPFLAINCQAYVDTLIESELFGYKGGSFTGAKSKGKPGKLELANGGTLFLDEIGELETATQVKLLRVLENREIEPVGGLKPIPVNFRLISATNQDLEKCVHEKVFREDLFYRINTVMLTLPPLRERREDIIGLARYFLKIFTAEQKKSITKFSLAAEQSLLNYAWPGNIRELKNVIEGAVALAKGYKLEEADLRINCKQQCQHYCAGLSFAHAKRRFEKDFLQYSFHQAGGNISLLARTIGVDRKQLYKKLTEYNILGKADLAENK